MLGTRPLGDLPAIRPSVAPLRANYHVHTKMIKYYISLIRYLGMNSVALRGTRLNNQKLHPSMIKPCSPSHKTNSISDRTHINRGRVNKHTKIGVTNMYKMAPKHGVKSRREPPSLWSTTKGHLTLILILPLPMSLVLYTQRP